MSRRELFKRGKNYWYRFELNGHEYYHSTRTSDLDTAKKVLEETKREIILGHHGIRSAPALDAVVRNWMETRGKNVSKAHARAARQSLASLEPIAHVPINRLTSAVIDGWRGDYIQTHSESSANLVLRYLKLWMRWAKEEGYLRVMPAKIKQRKVQERERPVVDLELVDEFLVAIDKDHRNPQVPAAIRFALMLGLRESEVLNARWEWIQAGEYLVGGNTKSKKLRRIKIPPPLWIAITRMLLEEYCGTEAHQKRHKAEPGPVPLPRLGLIFPGEDGPHTQGWLRCALRRGAKALKIDTLGMHRLRATFATLQIRNGASLKAVQLMLGHSDPRTTMIYHEVSRDEMAQAQDSLWGAG